MNMNDKYLMKLLSGLNKKKNQEVKKKIKK